MAEQEVGTRYVEVEEIRIADRRRASKFRVVFKHNSGAQETFETSEKSAYAEVPCKSYVDIAGQKSTLQVMRRDKMLRSSKVPEVTLAVKGQTKGWFDANFPSECGLRVEIRLGIVVPATQVADERLKKAMDIMKSKQKMMGILETSCEYLSLLSKLGESVAEVNAAAGAVAKIAQFALQRVADIPASFQKLSRVALDLVDQLETARAAKKVFSSKHVGKALDRLIELIIRTGEELIYCYSRSKSALVIKEWLSSRREETEQLERDLEKHKQNISQAFLVEVQDGVVIIQDGVDEVKVGVSIVDSKVDAVHDDVRAARRQAEENEKKELLSKLLPPNGSLFHGQVTCYEGTRKTILESVDTWANDEALDHRSRLFWIHGVAGCGKSSVAATICRNLKNRLAGSFFCKRDQDERRNAVRILWSVALSLARANPAFEEALLATLREPDIFVNMDFDTQLDRLLLQPLSTATAGSVSTPMVFVVDALDECLSSDKAAQAFAKIIGAAPWMLFVLTSRDLPSIRNGLSTLATLKTDYDLFQDDARDDISAYLRFQFLPDKALAELEPYIEEEQIQNLVDKSQGLFIWMRTVVEFIIRTDVGKLEVLESVLAAKKAGASESALDDIYRTVLETAAGASSTAKELVRLILGLILVTSSNEPLNAEALHAFLPPSVNALQTEFDTILKKMSPVLLLGSTGVRVYHTSFLDFSSSETRCGALFYTDAKALNSIMTFGCFEIMQSGTRNKKRQSKKVVKSGLKFNICGFESSYSSDSEISDFDERVATRISHELAYSSCYWFEHMWRYSLSQDDREQILEMVKELLCSPRSLYWLELLAITKKLHTARPILLCLQPDPLVTDCKEIKDAVADLRSFIDHFQGCISESTPHLYLSTLPWIPSDSFVWKAWQSTFKVGLPLARPIPQQSLMLQHIVRPKTIYNVSVSADGSLFATGGEAGAVVIFDMQTGRKHGSPLKGHSGTIMAMSFSPKEDILVSSSLSELCFRVWDTESRSEVIEPFVAHRSPICALAFSRDGTRLATGSAEGTVKLWDTRTWGSVGSELKGHRDQILSVAFSPDGSRVASSSLHSDICLWNIDTFTLVGDVMRMHKGYVYTLLFSPDGSTLFSGGEDCTIRVWDGLTGQEKAPPLRGHRWYVRSLVISNDGSMLLSGSGDSSIRVWNAKTGQSIGAPIKGPQLGFAGSFALSSDGTRGVVASGAHDVTVWDIDAALRKASLRGHSHHVFSLSISPDGSRFASGGWDNSVFIWSSDGKLLNDKSMDHAAIVFSVKFSPDGKRLVSADQDGFMRIWDVETYSMLREFKAAGWVNMATWSPDGSRLAVAKERGPFFLRFWDPQTGESVGKPLQGHPHGVKNVVYSPDGSRLATVADTTVRIWDVATGTQVGEPLEGHTETPEAVAFSPDGSKVASGSWDKTVKMWDVSTGKQLFDDLKHDGAVQGVIFSPDGRYIYTASWDHLVRAWDATTGKLAGIPLRGHTDPVNCVAISRDGKTLISGGRDNAIRVWDAQSFFWQEEESQFNCELLGPDRIPKLVPADGWVRTSKGELVLWIPSQYRKPVCDMSHFCISIDQEMHPIRIKWNEMCEGAAWENIRL